MKLNKPLEMSISATFEKQIGEDNAPLKIKGFANTTTKDRAGDIIPRSAWEGAKALPNYEKNPIILAFHDHSRPIGKMVGYTISDEGLEIEAEISKSAPEYGLIADGVLKSFSVGFRLLDAEYKSEVDAFMIKELELLEVSVVSVPCNQDSTFELSKSLNGSDFDSLRKQLRDEASDNKTVETDGEDADFIDELLDEIFTEPSTSTKSVLDELADELGL